MDKLFLVLRIYENIDPAIYLVEGKNLEDFTDKTNCKTVKIYEWDVNRLMESMQEIEVSINLDIKKI